MLRYKFRFNSFLSEALYMGLFYEHHHHNNSNNNNNNNNNNSNNSGGRGAEGLSYSSAISWIRAKVSFAIVRSAILCLRGSRS